MVYYGLVEDIRCAIGMTIPFELWSYDRLHLIYGPGQAEYVTGRPGRNINCGERPGRIEQGSGRAGPDYFSQCRPLPGTSK